MPNHTIYDFYDGDYVTFTGPDPETGEVSIRAQQGDTTAEIGPANVWDVIDVLKEIADAAEQSEDAPTTEDFSKEEWATTSGGHARACRPRPGFWLTESVKIISDAEMADRGWKTIRTAGDDTVSKEYHEAQIATLRAQIKDQSAPTTPRECLALLRQIVESDERYALDDGTVHAGEGYVTVWGNGDIVSNSKTTSTYAPFSGLGTCYLLDPREPEPEWHTAQLIHATAWADTENERTCRWALDASGGWFALDGSNRFAYHDDLTNVSVVCQGDESRG